MLVSAQNIGEVILADFEDSCFGEHQANLARISKQPSTNLKSFLLERDMMAVVRHFLTIATTESQSQSCLRNAHTF